MAARVADRDRDRDRDRRPSPIKPGSDSSSIQQKLFGGSGPEDRDWDRDREDGPVVFICGTCRAALGDSESWDGSEDQQNQIRLKKVTDGVLMGTDTRLHEATKRSACLVVDLVCRGCGSVVGMVYTSTPKNLDHKRLAFCLDVAQIDSYLVGSADQDPPLGGDADPPVSLQLRGLMEQQLEEMKLLVVSMAQRMEEMESVLEERRDETEQ